MQAGTLNQHISPCARNPAGHKIKFEASVSGCRPGSSWRYRGARIACRMLLDLSRALSFFVGIVSLYWAGISAFFVPATGWNERLLTTLVRLSLSAGVCLVSGLCFAWPVKARLRTPRFLMSTLPVQLFLWGSIVIAVLFVSSWYLDSYPCTTATSRICS